MGNTIKPPLTKGTTVTVSRIQTGTANPIRFWVQFFNHVAITACQVNSNSTGWFFKVHFYTVNYLRWPRTWSATLVAFLIVVSSCILDLNLGQLWGFTSLLLLFLWLGNTRHEIVWSCWGGYRSASHLKLIVGENVAERRQGTFSVRSRRIIVLVAKCG